MRPRCPERRSRSTSVARGHRGFGRDAPRPTIGHRPRAASWPSSRCLDGGRCGSAPGARPGRHQERRRAGTRPGGLARTAPDLRARGDGYAIGSTPRSVSAAQARRRQRSRTPIGPTHSRQTPTPTPAPTARQTGPRRPPAVPCPAGHPAPRSTRPAVQDAGRAVAVPAARRAPSTRHPSSGRREGRRRVGGRRRRRGGGRGGDRWSGWDRPVPAAWGRGGGNIAPGRRRDGRMGDGARSTERSRPSGLGDRARLPGLSVGGSRRAPITAL
ncbi:MAG: hypothetical protein AVDCRST_MAG49-692 [uncultured Thermomicrobiales bacterium]|uniref:Uncharacterized protein n=1 Tax=uncultured Thermomicrobiales bacterium TaxID=1645740 RepID=A0A6J4U390_9BACT|nr:MAG: hypothetical protein AVDCRST_MAG49-692 [uncultured Thermomicrobiales bacterium]